MLMLMLMLLMLIKVIELFDIWLATELVPLTVHDVVRGILVTVVDSVMNFPLQTVYLYSSS